MRYGSAPSSTYSLRTTRLPHCHTLHTIQLCVTFVIYPTGAKPPTPDHTTGAHPPHTHPAPSATDTPADTCEHTASVNSPTNTQPSSSTHSLIGLHPQRIVVEVQGMEYDLPIPTNQIFEAAVAMAIRYSTLLTRKPARTPPIATLRTLLEKLTTQFSRAEAERLALADAGEYCITEERLDRDIAHLRKVGSLEAVIQHYHTQHQESGPNPTRVTEYLSADPKFPLIQQIVTKGAQIDTPPEFTPNARIAPFRNLQKRLAPVYHKAVAGMHDTNKVLLFRVSDLTAADRERIHMANEYHWRPEPGKVAGRPLLDCSNAPVGQIPLNSDFTRVQGIQRYQRVQLPTLREVVQHWDTYRQTRNLQWNDMWMFKADITGCFNQLFWNAATCLLMGFLLGATLLMIMITCGFGVAVTPMI